MTNKEAADLLENKILLCVVGEWREAIEQAINALTLQTALKEKCLTCEHCERCDSELSNNSPELDKENGELISRQDAIEHLKKRLYESALNNDGIASEIMEEIANNRIQIWMDELPPSPSRPQIYCNKCKHYQGVHGVQGHAPCSYWKSGGVLWNWYCSQAEPL